MKPSDDLTAQRSRIATELRAHGHTVGIHSEHGVVLLYNDRVWRVAGGNACSPSLLGLRDVRVQDVDWSRK